MSKSLTATLKYALVSDKKMSLMAKLVKGKKVEDALNTLSVLPKKSAKILLKVIKSAYSNAKNA
jgi:large subunit ribosomal protein L22